MAVCYLLHGWEGRFSYQDQRRLLLSKKLRTMLLSQNIEKVSMKLGECDLTSTRFACRTTQPYDHAVGKGANVVFSSFRSRIIASTRTKEQSILLVLKCIRNGKPQEGFGVEWR